jgi:hypothetical protein
MKKAAAPKVSVRVPPATLDRLLEPENPSVRFFTLWTLEQTISGRMLVGMEKKDRPGKGVTLKALTVLKTLSGGTSWSGC